ncbi:hypothetical protein [Clostridium sp. BSD9I1]|nr:hypothetical protein [Clostridium sp. BSD9I1]
MKIKLNKVKKRVVISANDVAALFNCEFKEGIYENRRGFKRQGC